MGQESVAWVDKRHGRPGARLGEAGQAFGSTSVVMMCSGSESNSFCMRAACKLTVLSQTGVSRPRYPILSTICAAI